MSNWNVLAELDPLWTILSEPGKKFGKWNPAEFFSTGEREAHRVLEMCKSHGIDVTFDRLLDFGCGVGRMTRGFSHAFQSCTGLDVSEKMISLAKAHNADRANCTFIASDAAKLPFESGTFDFVFTVLVLQHLPTKKAILEYVAEFIRVVKDGGVISFQLPIAVPVRRRIQLRRRLWAVLALLGVPKSWLFMRAGLAPIQINGIARNSVEKFISSHGAELRGVERYDPNEGSFHSNYYLVVKKGF